MKKQHIKGLIQFALGIGLAALLLWLTLKDRPISDLANDLKDANLWWLAGGGLFLLVAHFFRAWRWKLLLDSANQPVKLVNTYISVLVCYMVNSVTPRLGEVVRCSTLYRSDKVPIASSLGTVFIERIIDLVILLVGVAILFAMEFQRLQSLLNKMLANVFGDMPPQTAALILGAIMLAGAIGVFLGFYFLKRLPDSGVIGKLKAFGLSMVEGIQSVFQLKSPLMFFVQTMGLWIALTMMGFCFLKALPQTEMMGIYVSVMVLFIGGIGWALPAPGGIGTTHYIVLQLFLALGYTEIQGQNHGVLSNGATFVFTIIFGLIAWVVFALQGFQNQEVEDA